MNGAVLLEGRQRQDPRADLFVARRDAEAAGFGQPRFLVDQLLQDATIDPHLLEHPVVDVAAVCAAVGLHLLLVDPPELGDGDVAAVDRRDHVPAA